MATSRFVKSTAEDRDELINGVIPEGTKRNTRYAVNLLKKWLMENYGEDNFEDLDEENLNNLLAQFYMEVRTEKGEFLSKSTFVTIRAGIQRHLDGPPFNKNFGITTNPAFAYSNRLFASMIKKCKLEGKDTSRHHPVIPYSDLEKILAVDAFNIQNPEELQMKVFFDLQYFFARRGRENLRNLKPSHFKTGIDDAGVRYVEMAINESTKNHPTTDDNIQKHRMYETKEPNCPVHSFNLYISKLEPQSPQFYCKRKTGEKFHPSSDEIWYTKVPLGINTLGNMMKKISNKLNLSDTFTNHSIRATVITVLSKNGFESREIMRVTGHKSETSLRSYDRDNTSERKRQISNTLALNPQAQAKQNQPESNKKQKIDEQTYLEQALELEQTEQKDEHDEQVVVQADTCNCNPFPINQTEHIQKILKQSVNTVKEQFKVNNMNNCTFNFSFKM